jgi:Sensors of blue-light using FAD
MTIRLASSAGLVCFSYRSIQAKHMTRADVVALLREAQMRNMNRSISGVMLRIDQRFLHYFEGPVSAVDHLAEQIRQDTRHFDFKPLYQEPISKRLFERWSMAFSELSSPSNWPGTDPSLLQRVLDETPPADGRGTAGDVFHRFWAECAATVPL